MKSVFVVQHLHTFSTDEDDVKMIGVYASEVEAVVAVRRLRLQPGFRDLPEIVDVEESDQRAGFYVEEYEIGKDHWQEGYATED